MGLLVACAACSNDLTPAGVDAGATAPDATSLADAALDTGIDSGIDAGASAEPDAAVAPAAAAAIATAKNQALCQAVMPFYWEIGDASGPLVSGSEKGTGDVVYTATSVLEVASASKWLYSTYWVQRVAGVLSADDIKFMNFWSGYTHFAVGGCHGVTTVGACLDTVNPDGTTSGTFDPTTENLFDYGGGHMQKHAALNGLGDLTNATLAAEIRSQIGTEIALSYTTPQLRKILKGDLLMNGVLGTHPVCTNPTTCALALSSPSPDDENWQYSIGHWVEDDPVVGDGAFSSAGAFGFYPWIDATKTLYGVLARKDAPGSGFASAKCGRLIRKAYVTAVEQ
jgi:hypothetical protein